MYSGPLSQDGEASEIRLRRGVMAGEMRVPPTNAFNHGRADRESIGYVLAFFAGVRSIEATRRIASMSAQPEAAQLG